MANSLLTVTDVTREALRILHQRLNFIATINRQYDDSFAKSGAKIGDSLKIRLPNQYTVRTGAVLQVQDTSESSVTLQVSTQKGVDMKFSSDDLTLDIDDFSKRILRPAVNVLAANIESDVLGTVYKDVYNYVGTPAVAMPFSTIVNARKALADNLTPDGDRYVCLDTTANVDLVDSLKGLFHDSKEVGKQYREGYIGRTAGFDFAENTLLPTHTVGAGASYQVDGASQTGASLLVKTGTGAISVGDCFTIASVFRVHPETKVSTGELQKFVCTAAYAGGAGTVSISPSITTSGAAQNVNVSPANNAAITIFGTASTAHKMSLAYHEDAFTFATADLVMPQGVDFARREQFEGISIRIIRAYDINNDQFPCRLDVLYGYKTLRAELACRMLAN